MNGRETQNGHEPLNGDYPEAEPSASAASTEAADLTEAQLEALLFVAERPLSRREIAAAAGLDRASVDARLGDLEVSLRARGIRLIADGDRVELVTAPEAGALIARYVGSEAVRLSPASLETLAIIAYRQPVTKAAIERIDHSGTVVIFGNSSGEPTELNFRDFAEHQNARIQGFHYFTSEPEERFGPDLALLAWLGKFSHGNHNTVEIAGLYWHFVDIVWVFLFPLLYLVGHR